MTTYVEIDDATWDRSDGGAFAPHGHLVTIVLVAAQA
jgi:hypothetical protein